MHTGKGLLCIGLHRIAVLLPCQQGSFLAPFGAILLARSSPERDLTSGAVPDTRWVLGGVLPLWDARLDQLAEQIVIALNAAQPLIIHLSHFASDTGTLVRGLEGSDIPSGPCYLVVRLLRIGTGASHEYALASSWHRGMAHTNLAHCRYRQRHLQPRA